MSKYFKRLLSLMVAIVMILPSIPVMADDELADWAFYVYMCGSNLESGWGCATSDIMEMLKADIPDNVRVIIMTGGSYEWDPNGEGAEYNEELGYEAYITPDSEHNQIFEIKDDGMELVKTYDSYMCMNLGETAETFVKEAFSYAPAKHTMISFWDHGGALRGAEYDERKESYKQADKKVMEVTEIADVIKSAKKLNGGKKIDLVGFDACVMSTVEVGYALSPYADYLVASEINEPGYGWYYDFLSMFSKSKKVPSATEVAKEIIDCYAYSENKKGDWTITNEMTMALTDLSKIEGVVKAFRELADDMVDAMDDSDTVIDMLRSAEGATAVSGLDGMVDLYDFAYRLKKVDELKESAERLIDVLGMPPGADKAGYNGYVGKSNYIGKTVGDNPAVMYRGTSYRYNNCIGLSVFYPTEDFDKTRANKLKFINKYKSFGMGDEYSSYITSMMALSENVPLFAGQLISSYDDNTEEQSVSIQPPDELDFIKQISYITTYTEVDDDYTERCYLLGEEVLDDAWEENKFTKDICEDWFNINGSPITVITDSIGHSFGCDRYSYTVPAYVVNEKGEEEFVNLSCEYEDPTDSYEYGGEDDAYLNKMVVTGVIPEDEDETENRTISPSDIYKIKPALAIYDMESHSVIGYKEGEEAVELTEDGSNYILPFERKDLVSNATTYYASYFAAKDIQNNIYLSEPFEYYIIDSFDEFKLVVTPQAYTGKPVEPEVDVLHHGEEKLEEGIDYRVTYTNNIEKGIAGVKVISLMPELPGELSGEFEICDEADVAEKTMKLLPEHEVVNGCLNAADDYYEYIEHTDLLESLMYYYKLGYNFSKENAAKLKEQYARMLAYRELSLENNGVELIGEYGLFDSEQHLSLVARSTSPVTENASKALMSAGTSGLIDCYYVGMYLPGDNNSLTKLDMLEGDEVAVKIDLPSDVSSEGLDIYRLTDESEEAEPIEYKIVSRDGERYAIFRTEGLGYFALFDKNAGFADVPKGSWYAESVNYVTDNGLMSGIGNNLFAPNAPLLRGELVAVLYRMDGEPEVSDRAGFKDVAKYSYYEAAVAWATENNIVSGYSADKFAPYEAVTREQLATILYRYAGYRGANVKATNNTNINVYFDANKVSGYAASAVSWACGENILSGTDGVLMPKGEATRAQTASILARLSESMPMLAAKG